MMYSEERQKAIVHLAAHLNRAGLAAPAGFLLDLLQPVDLICCQVALFLRPFTPGVQGRLWANLLADETSWQELRRLIGTQSGSEQSN